MKKILVICGPTATGKTGFALDICRQIGGEIISADSRQVYAGMDVVTGKDLPKNTKMMASDISWNRKKIGYYIINGVRLWLYDLVSPQESFSVSHWHQAAKMVIADIYSRKKFPVVVGGTGLYIRSLLLPFPSISVPPNPKLRRELSSKSSSQLFSLLHVADPPKADSLNVSDRANPRRLIRALEISRSGIIPDPRSASPEFSPLIIGLRADRSYLKQRIADRVQNRLSQGARREAEHFLSLHDPKLPSMTSSGYRAFKKPDWVRQWTLSEQQYLKRQLSWFNRQPDVVWFDIGQKNWQSSAEKYFWGWYNKSDVQKS